MVATSPASITRGVVEAETVKFAIFAGGWAGKQMYWVGMLLAIATPVIPEICLAVVVMIGVIVVVTVVCAPAARVGIEHVIVIPWTGLQVPPAAVVVAVGDPLRPFCPPEVGRFPMVKMMWVALSGPLLAMLKVKVTALPALMGLGDGLVDAGVTTNTLSGPMLLTNASGRLPTP